MVIHLLVIKTLVESNTHVVLILQNYVGVIQKRVPPLVCREEHCFPSKSQVSQFQTCSR